VRRTSQRGLMRASVRLRAVAAPLEPGALAGSRSHALRCRGARLSSRVRMATERACGGVLRMATRVWCCGPSQGLGSASAGAEPGPCALPCLPGGRREGAARRARAARVRLGRRRASRGRAAAALCARDAPPRLAAEARPLAGFHQHRTPLEYPTYHTVPHSTALPPALVPQASGRQPACAHQGGCTDRSVHCGPASYTKLA